MMGSVCLRKQIELKGNYEFWGLVIIDQLWFTNNYQLWLINLSIYQVSVHKVYHQQNSLVSECIYEIMFSLFITGQSDSFLS